MCIVYLPVLNIAKLELARTHINRGGVGVERENI